MVVIEKDACGERTVRVFLRTWDQQDEGGLSLPFGKWNLALTQRKSTTSRTRTEAAQGRVQASNPLNLVPYGGLASLHMPVGDQAEA